MYLSETAIMNSYPVTPEVTIRMDCTSSNGSVSSHSCRGCRRNILNAPILKKKKKKIISINETIQF